jgi:hypothetical protein
MAGSTVKTFREPGTNHEREAIALAQGEATA